MIYRWWRSLLLIFGKTKNKPIVVSVDVIIVDGDDQATSELIMGQ